MFFGGKLKSMPPKLVSDDGKHVVIRPLAYCKEKDLIRYADWKEFPIIPCNLCGSQENLQRKAIKQMLNDWDKRFPGRIEIMFRSLQNVVPSHLLDNHAICAGINKYAAGLNAILIEDLIALGNNLIVWFANLLCRTYSQRRICNVLDTSRWRRRSNHTNHINRYSLV